MCESVCVRARARVRVGTHSRLLCFLRSTVMQVMLQRPNSAAGRRTR